MSCRNHPQVETELEHCYRCGYRYCGDCVVEFQGKPTCGPCKDDAVGRLESGDPTGGSDEVLPPWERRQTLGMFPAFWQSITGVLGAPTKFFVGMDKRAATWDCLAIPVVASVLGAIVSMFVGMAMGGVMESLASGAGGGGDALPFGSMIGMQGVSGCFGIVLSPILTVIGVFIGAGLIHAWLAMTSNVRLPFHQTMRGYCYAQAPAILAVIPVLGGLVGAIWAIVTSIIMVKAFHKTTTGTAVMSVFWFVILMLCLAAAGAAVFAGIMAANQ